MEHLWPSAVMIITKCALLHGRNVTTPITPSRRFEKNPNRKQFKRSCEVFISKLDVISSQQYTVHLN